MRGHGCTEGRGKALPGLNGATWGSWCWREHQRGDSRWDVPWSNISKCFPCVLLMLEQPKGVERIKQGSGFDLVFLLWFYVWVTAERGVFLSAQAVSDLHPQFFPRCSQAEAFAGFLWMLRSTVCPCLALVRAEMNEEQKRGNMAHFVVSLLSPAGIWDV